MSTKIKDRNIHTPSSWNGFRSTSQMNDDECTCQACGEPLSDLGDYQGHDFTPEETNQHLKKIVLNHLVRVTGRGQWYADARLAETGLPAQQRKAMIAEAQRTLGRQSGSVQ